MASNMENIGIYNATTMKPTTTPRNRITVKMIQETVRREKQVELECEIKLMT